MQADEPRPDPEITIDMPATAKLLQLFDITISGPDGGESMLLVVAASRQEARALARPRGRVTGISVNQGPLAVQGRSRVIGAVARRRVGPEHRDRLRPA